MSNLNTLIAQHCPDGVEYRELGECASIKRGRRVTKNELNPEKKYPVYSGGVTPMGYFEKHNQLANTITVVKYGTAGFVNFIEEDFWANDVCYCVKPSNTINNKYLFYVLKSKQDFIQSQATNAIPAHLPTEAIERISIPTPPLPIQQEIANILDNFTQLNAELNAELEARRKQYEYFQSELLNFNEGGKWIDLKEIADFSQGIQVDPSEQLPNIQDGFVQFLRIVDFVKDDEPPRYIENPGPRFIKNEGDLIMIRYGASAAGKVFLKYSGAIANNMFQIKLKTKDINIKFLYCFLSQAKIYNLLNTSGGKSTMPAVTFGQIGSIKIPIPTHDEQERIISILDKFDKLVNDTSEGLPAEIEARGKQYEYYRGKLLDFKNINHG